MIKTNGSKKLEQAIGIGEPRSPHENKEVMEEAEKMIPIGSRLRDARLLAGMSQVEAAKIAGVSRSALSHWEAGRSVPNILQFKALIALYGVLGYYILFGANPLQITREDAAQLSSYAQYLPADMQARLRTLLALLTKAGSGPS